MKKKKIENFKRETWQRKIKKNKYRKERHTRHSLKLLEK